MTPDRASRLAVDALNERAHAMRHQDARAALALVEQAATQAQALGYTKGLAYAELRIALLRYVLGEEPAEFLPHLTRAVTLLRELGDAAGEAEALSLRASIHDTLGELQQAEEQQRLALAIRRDLGDTVGIAGSLNNLGITLRAQGRHAEALDLLMQSLDISRESGDRRAAAYAQLNIGTTLAGLGDPAAAVPRLQEAIELVRGTADRGLECSALTELGAAQVALGQRDAALASLHAAWTLAEATGNAGDQGQVLSALGGLHQALGAFSTAEERLQTGLVIARRRAEHATCAELLRLLGRNKLLLGQPAQALPLLQEALAVAQKHQLALQVMAVHELLSQAHEALGDFAAALAHLRQHQRDREAALSQATLRRVHERLLQQQMSGLASEARAQRDLAQSLRDALDVARQAEQEKTVLLAEVAAQSATLQQLAREDGLTGVANRRWFDTQWPQELERARRHAHPLAVAMVDIDDFKSINDRFSHAVGDEVLRRCARVLRDSCRGTDLVARYGGEEFVLMFVETPLAGAQGLCEKLRQRVQAVDWSAVHAGLPPVTVSIGLACWTPEATPNNVLGDADAALYRAKDLGKNRVALAA